MKVWTVPRVDSEGYAIAPVFVLRKMEFMPEQRVIDPNHAEAEIRRYELAVEKVQQDLMELSARDDIFFAHSVLAGDMALHDGVAEKIGHSLMNAESALLTVGEGYVRMFEAMEKEYMRERATDLKDVMCRILMALQGREETMVEAPEEAYILAARDLTPSDTAKLNLEHVAGIVMEEGGITSHVSIIARNYGIPCLVGAGELLSDLQQGLVGIVDAQLIKAAKENDISFAVDVYPHYGSDADAALAAGYDVRHGLIGPGVFASHGYERSHRLGAENTFRLLCGYLV